MSDFGDYLDEMERNRLTDTAIDDLFAGSPTPGGGLEPLAGVFGALRTDLDNELDDEAIGRIAAIASAAVGTPAGIAAKTAHRARFRFLVTSLRRRAATVTVAATVFLGGTSGLAVAANGAMPGDALYGVDRALESVGIGAGGQQERLVEADALIVKGDVVAGLRHAAEAFDTPATDGSTTQVLMEAADRVRAAGTASSSPTGERATALLAYLSENAGDIDGQHVAQLAVQIGRPDDQPVMSDSPGRNGDPGSQAPSDPPGLTDREPGPPDHVPSNPPGQDKEKKEPGQPEGVPADPPGQDKDKNEPGPPETKPNPPDNKP